MIDEINDDTLKACSSTDQIEVHLSGGGVGFYGDNARELIRLARLGLWVESRSLTEKELSGGEESCEDESTE